MEQLCFFDRALNFVIGEFQDDSRICSNAKCGHRSRFTLRQGFCYGCYFRLTRFGDPDMGTNGGRQCGNCGRAAKTKLRGAIFCMGCDHRLRRYGDPNKGGLRRYSGEVPDGHRYCNGCKQILPLNKFTRNPTKAQGRASRCRPCDNIDQQARRYGLARQVVIEMMAGICAIDGCTRPAECIDHKHDLGLKNADAVRDALCQQHNFAIGHLSDNADEAYAIAKYLEKWS